VLAAGVVDDAVGTLAGDVEVQPEPSRNRQGPDRGRSAWLWGPGSTTRPDVDEPGLNTAPARTTVGDAGSGLTFGPYPPLREPSPIIAGAPKPGFDELAGCAEPKCVADVLRPLRPLPRPR
jgi:hypothetical protein